MMEKSVTLTHCFLRGIFKARNLLLLKKRNVKVGNIKMKKITLAVLMFAFSGFASANLIVSTLPETEFNSVGPGYNDYAAGFIWNSNSNFDFAEVFLNVIGSPDPLIVALYDNAGGTPSLLVETLTGNVNPTTAGIYSYFGNASLVSGNTYWLVLSTGAANRDRENQYIWWDGTFGDANYVNTLWRTASDPWTTSGIVTPAAFAVHSETVSEPATLAIFSAALLFLVRLRRR